ncbi:hypothetical protein P3S67_023191 [Capsicum chacoense]
MLACNPKNLNTMDNTFPTSPTQWMDHDEMPYYYQQTDFAVENPHEYFSDSTFITTKNTQNSIDHYHHHQDSVITISPENSSQISGNNDIHHELISPKSSVMKPIRRRSRASKKTPITRLNASIANFRALVQQHTGCHSSPTFKNQKGPINLSFGPSTDDDQNEYSFGSYYNHEDQAEKYSKDNSLQQEEQESGTSASAGYSINSGNSKLSVNDYGW